VVRIALDLMGGDHAPESVVEGALLVAAETPDVHVVLVGPPDVAERLLAERGQAGRLEVVAASEVVAMDEDPARATRSKSDATVRVCARLVRDRSSAGGADAMVSIGSTGAALTAAVLTIGRLKGISRPPLAAVVPAKAGPLVFLDAGANPEASADLLAQYALVGAAFATVRLGIPEPRVGLLTNGGEAGKGDAVRKEAYDALSALPVRFVGCVEGRDVPYGGPADVIVTDGFTGNVLIKGIEGTASMLTELLLAAMTSTPERAAAAQQLLPAFGEVTAQLSTDVVGGAVLLGLDGVCVVGHGAAGPRAVASCIAMAAEAVREGLVAKVAAALSELAGRRQVLLT
jgi:glycerol-3-phosphate acyltransferase PlsX